MSVLLLQCKDAFCFQHIRQKRRPTWGHRGPSLVMKSWLYRQRKTALEASASADPDQRTVTQHHDCHASCLQRNNRYGKISSTMCILLNAQYWPRTVSPRTIWIAIKASCITLVPTVLVYLLRKMCSREHGAKTFVFVY